MRGNVSYAIIFLALFGLGFVFFSNQPEDIRETLILETERVAELPPHPHDAGEAVEDMGHHRYAYGSIFTAPRDLWISSASFDLVNAPDTSVHHADLLNLDELHQNCSNLISKQLFQFVQDNMHAPRISFPNGTGMLLPKGERFVLFLMVHNPLPPVGPGGTYEDVFGKLTLSLYPENETEGLKNVKYYPAHLNQIPCETTLTSDGTPAFTFNVPAGAMGYEFSATTTRNDPARFSFQKPSTVVYVGGHLHGWQGGKKVTLNKNGEPFLEFATTLSEIYPYRYDTPYYPTKMEFSPEDTLSVSATYDNPSDKELRGAMGIVDLYYYER